MTANCLTKIHRQTGASWSQESKTWTCDETGRPFTPKTYQQYRSKLSEMPEPEWYLEQIQSHVATIQELFKTCPPLDWKRLSFAIGDALVELDEKFGSTVNGPVQTKGKSRKEKRFGKG